MLTRGNDLTNPKPVKKLAAYLPMLACMSVQSCALIAPSALASSTVKFWWPTWRLVSPMEWNSIFEPSEKVPDLSLSALKLSKLDSWDAARISLIIADETLILKDGCLRETVFVERTEVRIMTGKG